MLIDSSALILFMKAELAPEGMALMQNVIEQSKGQISVIARAEVLAWPQHTDASLLQTTQALAYFQTIAVDVSIADEAARVRREHGLKLPDALIAATALLAGQSVITANERDFKRVVGLGVVAV